MLFYFSIFYNAYVSVKLKNISFLDQTLDQEEEEEMGGMMTMIDLTASVREEKWEILVSWEEGIFPTTLAWQLMRVIGIVQGQS